MSMKIEVFDLTKFSIIPRSELKPRDVYMDRGIFYVQSEINRDPIYASLCGDGRNFHFDDCKAHGRSVAVLSPGLSTKLVPLAQPQRVSQADNIHGCAVVMGEGNPRLGGGAAICASLGEDEEPGRIAMFVANGISEFHYREFTTVFSAWRLEWRDPRGEPILALTMQPDE